MSPISSKLSQLKVAVLGAFILGIIFSGKLWLSDRIYPITPVFHMFPAFSNPLDWIILAILCGLLIYAMFSRRPAVIFTILTLVALLFLQDQTRLYPSFYEYSILLSLLGLYLKGQKDFGEKHAERTLMLCQFVLVAVYFWSGISKLNPYFIREVMPWLIGPLHLSIYASAPVFFGLLAALLEIISGICLLFPRTRKIALYELLCMHGLLFFLIGPFRGNNNDSAWTWNLASAVFLYILFSNTPRFSFKESFDKLFRPFSKTAFILLILVGILPALNLLNLWDSALSFNVYSGNTDEAIISMNQSAFDKIDAEAQQARYLKIEGSYKINLDLWNSLEFNAGAYPQIRIFKNVFRKLCDETGQDSSLQLITTEKANILNLHKTGKVYLCYN